MERDECVKTAAAASSARRGGLPAPPLPADSPAAEAPSAGSKWGKLARRGRGNGAPHSAAGDHPCSVRREGCRINLPSVPLQLVGLRAGGGVPQPHCVILGGKGKYIRIKEGFVLNEYIIRK